MNGLSGLRVLIVEDEGSVAFLIEDILESLGCEIVASVAYLARATEVAEGTLFDFAILDVNVRGEPVFPFARTLQERGVPFMFCTGYGETGIPSDLDTQVVMSKPFTEQDLQRAIGLALAPPSVATSKPPRRPIPYDQDI